MTQRKETKYYLINWEYSHSSIKRTVSESIEKPVFWGHQRGRLYPSPGN